MTHTLSTYMLPTCNLLCSGDRPKGYTQHRIMVTTMLCANCYSNVVGSLSQKIQCMASRFCTCTYKAILLQECFVGTIAVMHCTNRSLERCWELRAVSDQELTHDIAPATLLCMSHGKHDHMAMPCRRPFPKPPLLLLPRLLPVGPCPEWTGC